jgi:hypothetical protein
VDPPDRPCDHTRRRRAAPPIIREQRLPHLGGFLLLAGVLVVLLASVNRSASRR